MDNWKKLILGLIAFLFMFTFPFALTWYSVNTSVLNSDTYKPLMPIVLDSLTKNLSESGNQTNFDENTSNLLLEVSYNWLDNIFDYINNKNELIIELPEDEILKPILKTMALKELENNPDSENLSEDQINSYFEDNYPKMKSELNLQLENLKLELIKNLDNVKKSINLIKLISLLATIISIIFIIIAILIIRNIRSIMNWVGTYLLLGSAPLFIFGIILSKSSLILIKELNFPQELIQSLNPVFTALFNNLIIYSGIFVAIGIILLFVKFAFKKE